jgi:Helix-turn-helix domain
MANNGDDFTFARPLLTESRAAEFLAVKPRTLRTWRYEKRGPQFVKLGHVVRYDLRDLTKFINAWRQQPT